MNAFNLWVGLGAALGLWRVARGAPQRQAGEWVNTGLGVLAAALAGARLFYAAENWGYFSAHALEIPQFWLGGLAWPGAVAGGWLALLGFAVAYRPRIIRQPRAIRVSFGVLTDRLYPLLAPVAITAWLGSWEVGAAYGIALPDSAWWGIRSPDQAGQYNPHFPLQPLAALSLLAFFGFLETRSRSWRPSGRLSSLAMAGLLVNLLAASLLTGSPAPIWGGLRIDTWAAVIFLALFAVLLLVNSLVVRISRKQSYSSL